MSKGSKVSRVRRALLEMKVLVDKLVFKVLLANVDPKARMVLMASKVSRARRVSLALLDNPVPKDLVVPKAALELECLDPLDEQESVVCLVHKDLLAEGDLLVQTASLEKRVSLAPMARMVRMASMARLVLMASLVLMAKRALKETAASLSSKSTLMLSKAMWT